jgi:4-coumarate--CoA ligase
MSYECPPADIYGLIVSLHFLTFAGMSLLVVPKFNFVQMCENIKQYKISVLL